MLDKLNQKNIVSIVVLLFLLIAGLYAAMGFYVVDETQQVVVTRFGKPIGRPTTQAGLKWRWFGFDMVHYFDKRLLPWDGDAQEITTLEKRYIYIDITARWKIVDALQFMQVVRTEINAQSRLDDIIDAATRTVIARYPFDEAIRNTNEILKSKSELAAKEKLLNSDLVQVGTSIEAIDKGRETLSREILELASVELPKFGIELIDVQIKRINYTLRDRKKVYEQMIAERQQAAEIYRSEGQGKKAEIQGQMSRELERISSEAYRTAEELRGQADAEAIKIYAEAFNKDPEFYSFYKAMDTYRSTVTKDTTLFLSTDSDYLRYLNSMNPENKERMISTTSIMKP